jgi:hypothetical protein
MKAKPCKTPTGRRDEHTYEVAPHPTLKTVWVLRCSGCTKVKRWLPTPVWTGSTS